MEPFVPQFQGRQWVDGLRALHVYVLPRPGVDDDLLAMAKACGPLLAGHPVDPQYGGDGDAGLLHLTGEMLADAPSGEYDQAARADLADALHAELADLAPFTTEAGPPLATVAGAVLDVWPDDEVLTVIERIRAAIRKTRGEAALQHSGGRPHISLGYSYRVASSDPLSSALRNKITPRRASLHVDRVHLLDVKWALDDDLGGWRMTWEPVAVIPLGTALEPAETAR
ncbi:hypothetical protein [Streptomyces sp. NPDC003006]